MGLEKKQRYRPGVSKLHPAGQIMPAKPFHLACKDILSVMKKCIYKELGWFGRW